MGKTILKTIVGLLIILVGLGIVGFIYVKGIGEDNLWVLGVAAFLLVVGILFLNRALADTMSPKPSLEPPTPDTQNPEEHKSMLEKNNEMLAQWKKTSDARDRLKMLEAAGSASESS